MVNLAIIHSNINPLSISPNPSEDTFNKFYALHFQQQSNLKSHVLKRKEYIFQRTANLNVNLFKEKYHLRQFVPLYR